MAFFLSMYVFSIVGFFIHYNLLIPQERTTVRIKELLLLYQIVFSLGMTSLLAFIGLSMIPDEIALYMGWPACPFQQELGNVNLAFGVLGVMGIWWRGDFWTATVLGFSVWILADGFHHLYDIFWNHNYAPGSTGVSLYTDFIVPIVLLILLPLYLKRSKD